MIDAGGEVLANRNVPNGVETILGVIGGLPPGTPAAFEAAFGWGWLLELLEDYGFDPHLVHPLQCKAIASARLKNDKVDAAILAQLLRADLLPEAWIAPPAVRQLRALLRHRAQLVRLRTLLRNRIHAVLAGDGHDRPAGCSTGPGRAWLAALELPAVSGEVIEDDLALIDALQAPVDRLDWEVHQRARIRTAGQGSHPACRRRPAHRAGHPRRGRRHHPVRLRAQARRLGGPHPHRPRLGPHRPARPHIEAGLGVAAVDLVRGGADRQALTAVRCQLPGTCPPPRQEDRHHRDRPQAVHPSLAPAHRGRARRRRPSNRHFTTRRVMGHRPGRVAKPRASSRIRMSRRCRAR